MYTENLYSSSEAGSLAYVIFTSGSSGKPKGVKIQHGPALNTCREVATLINMTQSDVLFGLSSLSFDLSVFDIFGTLSVGGKLVLCGPEDTVKPHRWKAALEEHAVTIWNSVPSAFHLFTACTDSTFQLRAVLLSGDWIPVQLARNVWQKCRLLCLGGATEASIWSNYHEVTKEPSPKQVSIPYGRALPGQIILVLDDNLGEVPDHEEGDIYIGGGGLALGYFNDLQQTSAAFIDSQTFGRLYKTGDSGRYLPDGQIEFLGRKDGQIKRHGFRVELPHISSVIERLSWVSRAVALPCPGTDELHCFVEMKQPFWNSLKEQEAKVSSLLGQEGADTCEISKAFNSTAAAHFWCRRSHREFRGIPPSSGELKDILDQGFWQELFHAGDTLENGEIVPASDLTLEMEGHLLELLSERIVDGQYRYTYASSGSARAVKLSVIKCSGNQWTESEYLPKKHALGKLKTLDLHEYNLPQTCMAVRLYGSFSSLQGYSEKAREDLLALEIGFMKGMLDEAAADYGWTWKLCHKSYKSTKEAVQCIFFLTQLVERKESRPEHILRMEFWAVQKKIGAVADDTTCKFKTTQELSSATWTTCNDGLTPHNAVLAGLAHFMLYLDVKANSPKADSEEIACIAVGKLTQLVMMLPFRKGVDLPWGWCPVYNESKRKMFLVGGPLTAGQLHQPQVFWSESWALQLLQRHLREHLPDHYHPDHIEFKRLPLSGNGKVDFAKLSSALSVSRMQVHSSADALHVIIQYIEKEVQEMVDWDCDWVVEKPTTLEFRRANLFSNLGLTSQMTRRLATMISHRFHLRQFNQADVWGGKTIEKIASVVFSQQNTFPADPKECHHLVPGKQSPQVQVSITSISIRAPANSNSLEAFWEALCSGADQVLKAPPQRISIGTLEREAGRLS